LLDRASILQQTLGIALHAVSTQLVDRLRGEPDMTAHRDAALDQEAHRVGHGRAALELDDLRSGNHEPGGICESDVL
jgi:hypothetical protein